MPLLHDSQGKWKIVGLQYNRCIKNPFTLQWRLFFFCRLGRHLLYMVWWFIFCAFTCSEAYMNVFKSPWYFHGVWMQTHSSRLDRRWGNVRTLKSELLQQNIQQVLLTLKWIKRVHRGLVFIPFLTSHWLCLCKISMLNLVFASAYYRCISKN